jgi:hypothetical protein
MLTEVEKMLAPGLPDGIFLFKSHSFGMREPHRVLEGLGMENVGIFKRALEWKMLAYLRGPRNGTCWYILW